MTKWLDEQFYLRTVKHEDANDLFEFSKDSEVTKYLTWKNHTSIDEMKWAIENIYLNKEGLPSSYAIVDSKQEKVIGIIDFNSSDEEISSYYQIGYFMNKDYWGQGVMSKALKLVLEIGFNDLNFEVIGITHVVENIGSQKVIEKNKFTYIKTFNNKYFSLLDKYRDIKYYELRKSDFYE